MTGLALALVAGGWTLAMSNLSHAAQNERWEYAEIKLDADNSAMPALNKLGMNGWELVNVASACQGDHYCVWYAYLKRRL
jgi:hypothetical protein